MFDAAIAAGKEPAKRLEKIKPFWKRGTIDARQHRLGAFDLKPSTNRAASVSDAEHRSKSCLALSAKML
jgi:hypothetical protein